MSRRFSDYDIIVVGGGHAGIEAALAGARMGESVLLITQTLDSIGRLSCNPSIGGIAKGNIVREIDALGGQMGKLADASMIQYRLLNKSRGPAVQAPRVQADKFLYAQLAKHSLELQKGLRIFQDTVVDVVCSNTSPSGIVENGAVQGVKTERGHFFSAKAVIIASGTFLEGKIYIGEYESLDGRLGERAAVGLGTALANKGFKMGRLKTGTPSRVLSSSADFSKMEEQEAESVMRPFSFSHTEINRPVAKCYITYTNEKTHQIIRDNIDRSPLFAGRIKATGARYCPSIEDKVVKFSERNRHQLFIEPEGMSTEEIYINGLSSSLPEDVQQEFLHTIPGLENAVITRPAYAVDYAYIFPEQLTAGLQTRRIAGLFTAGQINGTSGYEEAGGQGIIAGINAALFSRSIKHPSEKYTPFTLNRNEAYIGVMIDDLITQGVDEPYRMFTARAEYRLKLRHNNADERLTKKAYQVGLQTQTALERFEEKQKIKESIISKWRETKITSEICSDYPELKKHLGKTIAQTLHDPKIPLEAILTPEDSKQPEQILALAELEMRYEDYIIAQEKRIDKVKRMENTRIPDNFDYTKVSGLSNESLARLKAVCPETLGQAGRIQGIRPSDIMLLMVHL
ncbi:MAG: tRNA uridine-5-carboxymethylaminomethyl(34) synthesis enzyme MnmG [Treponema sp.]|nr:MAG: tRNA uridine-5-carboxymethylaminomethyl(34) synthesis enzyme MnmG [Treponema sp.]